MSQLPKHDAFHKALIAGGSLAKPLASASTYGGNGRQTFPPESGKVA